MDSSVYEWLDGIHCISVITYAVQCACFDAFARWADFLGQLCEIGLSILFWIRYIFRDVALKSKALFDERADQETTTEN